MTGSVPLGPDPTVVTMVLPTTLAARSVTDPDVRATYAVDQSLGASPPVAYEVVRARDVADVADVLTWAQATGTPVVPQGARSGLAGGAVALEGGVVLNLEGLDTIHEINVEEGIAVVGPGVVNADLKAAVARHGLFYPPDPSSASWCTLGGNIATNAGGLCCVKYGVTADYVRGLEVVLAGGEVIRTGRRTAKGVAGLDLTGLFVGSEGTLGVVTEAVLTLVPAPDPALTALATFDTLAAASEAIAALRRDRHRPSLLEFLDHGSIAAIQAVADYGFPEGSAAVLLVQADRPDHVAQDLARYAEILAAAGATEVAVADDAQESEALLEGRRALNPALERKGSRFLEDVCVPVGQLTQIIERAQQIGRDHGVEVTMAGHGGDGNLHPSFFFTPGDEAGRDRAERAFLALAAVALEVGGTISGEHGIGSLKAALLPREVGEASIARQRAIKALFDPAGIMNPGRVYWS